MYVRSVSDHFLYTQEICLDYTELFWIYLSIRMSEGNFGHLESFWLIFFVSSETYSYPDGSSFYVRIDMQ